MSKFNLGDLAITLSPCGQYEAGCVVEVIEFIRDGDPLGDGDEADGDGWTVQFRDGGQAFFVDEYLMPLRGDFQTEQQKAKEEIA